MNSNALGLQWPSGNRSGLLRFAVQGRGEGDSLMLVESQHGVLATNCGVKVIHKLVCRSPVSDKPGEER